VTLSVELVEPEGEIWAGEAELVVARTTDGEIGLLTNHAPVIGILYEGSLVQIRPATPGEPDIFAAVSGGFVSMADNRVSILARRAQLGRDVDTAAAQSALTTAAEPGAPGQAPGVEGEDTADARYYQALLDAAERG
jgi:F-type H+-transporting ATPase subunit epsilon